MAALANTLDDSGILSRILRRRGSRALGCYLGWRLVSAKTIAKKVWNIAGSHGARLLQTKTLDEKTLS